MIFDLDKMRVQLERHEGIRLSSYQDTEGVWTIGVGRNLQTMRISPELARQWLEEDIISASTNLERRFPIVNRLSERRRQVLVNMTFNMGISRLSRFKKMWEALDRQDYITAAAEMKNSKWARQVGRRADELITMMKEG